MRMVSKKFTGKNLALVAIGLTMASLVAFAANSPAYLAVKQAVAPLQEAELKCDGKEYDTQDKKTKCQTCKQAVDGQKEPTKGAVDKAGTADATANANAGNGAAGSAASGPVAQHGRMSADQGAKTAALNGFSQRQKILSALGQKLRSCSKSINDSCKDEDLLNQKDKEGKQKASDACDQAASKAESGAKDAGDKAKESEDQAKKDDKNGQGMQPPQMPQMPQQQDKPKESGVASNTATSTAVGASSLSGNQLANQKVGIGGDTKSTDTAASTSTGYGGRNFGASGISTGNDPKFNGAGEFGGGKGGSPFNSSGASAMGGGFGGSGSEGGGKGAEAQAAAAAAQKQEDLDAYSNGGARPSYLGMKSKGSELSDLGLDAAAGTAPAADGGAGDRSVASTEQGANAGIGGEDGGGGSVFNMIHERLQEVGRRGSI